MASKGRHRQFKGKSRYPILLDENNVLNSETESLTTGWPNSNAQASTLCQVENPLEEHLICQVCFQAFYDGDKRPKVLQCGHSFCTSCLRLIISQPACSYCPNCNAEIKYRSSEAIPTNFVLLQLISTIKDDLKNLRENKFSLEVNKCNEEVRTIFEKNIVEWNKLTHEKVKSEIETRNLNKVRTNESLNELKEKVEELKKEMKKKEEDLKNFVKQIQELECQQLEEANLCIKLKNLLASVEKSINENKISDSLSQLDGLLVQRVTQNPLLAIPLKQFPKTRQSLDKLCQSVPVYAKTMAIENTLYGKIVVKDGRIFIFSFQHQKPEAQLIPFDHFLNEFNVSPYSLPDKVFLLLDPEEDGESIELIIEVDLLTRRGLNFALLSSALRKETYKSKTVAYFYNIFTSTTTYGLSSGPPPIKEGIKTSDNRTPLVEGLVYGMNERDSFFMITMDGSRNYRQHRIGIVISGLQ